MRVDSLPLVSVITVVYNGEKTIQQTISSVSCQTYSNIEYIIIDGLSNDNTKEIIHNNIQHIHQFISEKDSGLYDAMNKGINMAKGELICLLNSDDWLEPNAVKIVVDKYLENPQKKIFHSDRYDIKNASKVLRKYNKSILKLKYYGMTFNHPGMFVHKDVYKRFKYNTNLTSMSDYQFVLQQYNLDKSQFLYIPTAYVNYRLDGVSSRMKFKKKVIEGYLSRRNAGMNYLQSLVGVFVNVVITYTYIIFNIIRINK
jgi:glycosyltransferase involved in cell wall biosynthesis